MSYREDVEALFHRAQALQAERDRQHRELASERSGAETIEAPAVTLSTPPPMPTSASLDAGAALESSLVGRLAWLPPDAGAPRVGDGGRGLLVGQLTTLEHGLVMRLLETLTLDTDRGDGKARQRAFDQLVKELRERLALPA